MNKVCWLLLALMVVPFLSGCQPVVEIRVLTDGDLTATAASTSEVPGTPAAMATPSPTATPGAEETAITPTPLPTVTPLPSPAATRPRPTPTVDSGPGATRIRFRTGAISATVSGSLAAQASKLYVLEAGAGQRMEVAVVSSPGGVSFAIWGENGTILKQHAEHRAESVLPSAQDYYLALYAGSEPARYELMVAIRPQASSGVRRIRFETGAVSAALDGRLESGTCAYYVLRALAGQRMQVQVSPGDVVGLEVLGEDGSLWSPGRVGRLDIESLPRTGDYYLTLCVPSSAEATGYTLAVTIPSG